MTKFGGLEQPLGYYRMWFCGFARVLSPHRASLVVVVPRQQEPRCLQAQLGPHVQDHQRLAWRPCLDQKAGLPESNTSTTQGAPPSGWVDCKSPSGSRKPARPRTPLLAPALRHAGHEGSSDSTGQPQRRSGSQSASAPSPHQGPASPRSCSTIGSGGVPPPALDVCWPQARLLR